MRDLCLESNVRGFEGPVSLGALFLENISTGLSFMSHRKRNVRIIKGCLEKEDLKELTDKGTLVKASCESRSS